MLTVQLIDYIFAYVSLTFAIPGIFGNIYILKTFFADKHLLSRKIFILIALTDITTSLNSAIPFGISRMMERKPMMFDSAVFCNISGVVFNITSRLSVFLISVLSFTRCLAIINPMQILKVNLVIGSILTYASIQLLIACIPFLNYLIHGTGAPLYTFNTHYTNCNWELGLIIERGTLYFQIAEYLLLFVPFFFPSILVVASCCVCVWSLRKSTKPGLCVNSSSVMINKCATREHSFGIRRVSYQKRNRATRTIAIVTFTFVILNFPYWVILLLFFIEQNSGLEIINYKNDYIRCLFIFCTNVSLYLNAGINPMTYIVRCKKVAFTFKSSLKNNKNGLLKMGSQSVYKKTPSPVLMGGKHRPGVTPVIKIQDMGNTGPQQDMVTVIEQQ